MEKRFMGEKEENKKTCVLSLKSDFLNQHVFRTAKDILNTRKL
jgi:hypothetical protein